MGETGAGAAVCSGAPLRIFLREGDGMIGYMKRHERYVREMLKKNPILSSAYIFHYYRLENGVQKWYELSGEIRTVSAIKEENA
jgi:hypothetical protein